MQETEHRIPAEDGISLFVRQFTPQAAADRHLFIVHGACEHGGRYIPVAREAVQRGWNVFLIDLRGHGLSGGVRTHVATFDEYVQDLATVLSHFGLNSARSAVLGQSTGGLILARFAEEYPEKFGYLVLLAPFFRLKLPVNRFTLFAGRILSYLLPQTRFRSQVHGDQLTHDPDILAERRQDPLIQQDITAGWFFEAERAMEQAFAKASDVHCPLLIMQGEEDLVVDPTASEEWEKRVSSADRTFILVPRQRHALLEDIDGPQTLMRIHEWLDAHLPSNRSETQPDQTSSAG